MAAKQECVKEMDNGIILAGLATRRLGSAPLNAFPHSSPLGLNKRLRLASSCCITDKAPPFVKGRGQRGGNVNMTTKQKKQPIY